MSEGNTTVGIDIDSFELATKGRRFEAFEIGQQIDHHWGRTVTAADATLFSASLCYFAPMYHNVEYARAHGHPECPVNPMLVLTTVVGLSVEDLSEAGGPFLGVEDCVHERPVYPGDTLYARSTVAAARPSASRPEYGIVSWNTEGHNQRGEIVIRYTRSNLVMRASVPR